MRMRKTGNYTKEGLVNLEQQLLRGWKERKEGGKEGESWGAKGIRGKPSTGERELVSRKNSAFPGQPYGN